MTANAPTAATSQPTDPVEWECAASENGTASPGGSTSAPGGPHELSPLEAAILSLDRDISNALAMLAKIQTQAAMFETFVRALQADMAAIRSAIPSARPGLDTG